jgi:hypothetical protein
MSRQTLCSLLRAVSLTSNYIARNYLQRHRRDTFHDNQHEIQKIGEANSGTLDMEG